MKNKFRAIGILIIAFVFIGLFVPTGRDVDAAASSPQIDVAG